MSSRLIEHIISDFRQYGKSILLAVDVYGFLERWDVTLVLNKNKVQVTNGSNLSQRIKYHSSDNSTLHIFIKNEEEHLEDLSQHTSTITFSLGHYLGGYHIESILDLSLE